MAALPIEAVYVDGAQPNKETIRNYFRDRTMMIAATKAELRSWTTESAPAVFVSENSSEYVYTASDVTSADDNDNIIVSADSKRYYKRQFLKWEGAWSGATAYQIGDAVQLSGSAYICILGHTNNTPPNATYWSLLASKGDDGAGFTRQGDWSSVTAYTINDVVMAADGNQYVAILTTDNTNKEPAVHVDWETYWELFLAKGVDGTSINPLGAWSAATTYNPDDLVVRTKNAYICTAVNLNQDPASDVGVSGVGTYWTLFASGGSDGAGSGDVVGPASATDGAYAKFDTATGKLLKNGTTVIPIADGGTGQATAAAAFAALKQGASTSATGVVELAEDSEAGAQTSTTVALTPKNLAVAEASVASAATTDLGAVTSDKCNITGTTTITSFGTIAAGVRKWIKFAAALTLTHNATSLILPSGANITTAAGDTAIAVSEGSGNWRVIDYTKASGLPVKHDTIGTGKHSMWIPATAMRPRATNGAAIGTYDSGSNDITLGTLDFDTTTAEYAQFSVAFGNSWNLGTVTFQPFWLADSSSGTVIFSLAGVAISNDDLINASMGTAQTSSDTLIATTDLHVGPESGAVTIGGTPAAGDLIVFQVARDISDTLAADARLVGIKLFWTSSVNTDA